MLVPCSSSALVVPCLPPLIPSSLCLVPRSAQESASLLHCSASFLRLTASALFDLMSCCWTLILARYSSIRFSQSSESWLSYLQGVYSIILTHFCCAPIYMAVIASDAFQAYLSVPPQLLAVTRCFLRLTVHPFFFPPLYCGLQQSR